MNVNWKPFKVGLVLMPLLVISGIVMLGLLGACDLEPMEPTAAEMSEQERIKIAAGIVIGLDIHGYTFTEHGLKTACIHWKQARYRSPELIKNLEEAGLWADWERFHDVLLTSVNFVMENDDPHAAGGLVKAFCEGEYAP